jgi:hypothetical protein
VVGEEDMDMKAANSAGHRTSGRPKVFATALILVILVALGAVAGATIHEIDLSGPESDFTTTVGTWESGGGTFRQTDAASGTWATQAAVYGVRTFGDFVLEYKVKVGTATWAGSAFRVPTQGGFGVDGGYTLIHGVVGTQLFDMKNKGLNPLAVGQGFIEGDFNAVRVVVSGTSFKVYVNEMERLSATFEGLDAYKEGYISLLAGNGTAEFKDVRINDEVSAIPTEVPVLEAPTRDPSIPTPTAEALFVGFAGEGVRLAPDDGKPADPEKGIPLATLLGVAGAVVLVFGIGMTAVLLRRRKAAKGSR